MQPTGKQAAHCGFAAAATAKHCSVGAGLSRFTVCVTVEFENTQEMEVVVANAVEVEMD